MEYKETIRDFLKRSKCNLDIIKNNRGYEFTQLLSNLISCLIFIKENRKIDQNSIDSNGLECKVISNSYKTDFTKNTKEFIRHLRNACCHYGVLIESKNNIIYEVLFTDVNRKGDKCEILMNIAQIEKVYNYLLDLI